MTSKKFLIFAPSFREDDGGGVVLHRLCALLNELGCEAYITRLFNGEPVYPNQLVSPLLRLAKHTAIRYLTRFNTNPSWNTPVVKSPTLPLGDEWIVVYPEIVFGNPLQAKNVVRWFLYRPGFHTGNVFFGEGEFHVEINSFAHDFNYSGAVRSSSPLHVVSYPFDFYNKNGALPVDLRHGTAYCLRKGKSKKIVHDLSGSELIDGKSHAEISKIFKRVKAFISYDPYTAYSHFAIWCGADSVVVPDAGIDKFQWIEKPADRYGLSYGFDDIEWARDTADFVLPRVMEKENNSKESVRHFAEEVLAHFCR